MGALGRGAVLALMATCNFVVFTFVALLGPFFPSYARSTYDASSLEIGLVFALYPIAQIAVCPLASLLCNRLGRVSVCSAGLVLLSASTALFALSSSMPHFMAARVVQGAAGAMVNVSAIAMVMQFSESLTRDMAVQEVVTGVGYMCGPPLGGLLYSFLSMTHMFLLLSLCPLLMLCLLLTCVRSLAPSPPAPSSPSSSPPPSLASLLLDPTVVLVALALAIDASAIGFLDPTLSDHVHRMLGLESKTAGLVFAIAPLLYCGGALGVSPLAAKWGNKRTIATGLLIVSLSFVLLGPLPPLHVLRFSKPGAWVLVVSCLIGVGLGSALIIVPSVPLMLLALEQRTGTDLKDAVAGVYICAWGVGDAVGPLLGGLLTGVLPSTPEVVCTSPDPDGGCLTAFPWASALYGGAVLLLWALLTCLVPGDKGAGADRVAKREASGDPSLVHLLHDEDRTVMPLNDPASPIVMEAATENGAHYQTIGRHPSARQKESFG